MARVVLGVVSFGFYIYSLTLLPLSEASVLNMTVPVTAGIFAALILKEKYDLSLFLITIFSFMGVVMIAKPSFLFGDHEVSSQYPNRV